MVILQKQVTETGGASTTAIHRLPTEMLLEILKIYQDCAPKPCPFDIARVCRLWKQVCYDYAPFWSKIDLDLAMRPSSKLDQKVTFWVARAQNALVDVTIRDSARANLRVSGRPIDEADLVSLANVLCGTMSRWRSLEVALLHTHATFFLQKFVGLVPSLRIFELRILCDHNRDESETMHSLYPILFTPHPDTESRTPLAVCLDDSIAIFPSLIGAAITKLSVGATLATAAVDDVLRLLESCPNLEDFYLSGDLPGEPSLGHRVVLSRLTRIRLGPLGYMSSLLSFLELSALQTFEISEVVWDSPLVDALRRIFQLCTSLSTVIMTRNNRWLMGANDAYTPFGGMPLALVSVTHFQVTGNRVAYPLLHQLLLPQVETLSIVAAPYDIIHHLASSSTQLRTLSIDRYAEAPENAPPLLLPLLTSLNAVDCPAFLHNLQAPQLTTLRTGMGHRHSLNVTRESSLLLRFIEHSTPPLIDLALVGLEIPDTELISCLEALPTLQVLRLRGCKTSDAVLRALARPSPSDGGPSWILPQLVTFRFLYNHGITPAGVIELLSSRNAVSDDLSASGSVTTAATPPRVNGVVDFSIDIDVSREVYLKMISWGDIQYLRAYVFEDLEMNGTTYSEELVLHSERGDSDFGEGD